MRAEKLIALYERERRGHPRHPEVSYKVFFLCAVVGEPRPHPGTETLGAAYFAKQALPPLSLARVNPEEIETAFAHHSERDLPTEFD